MRPPPERCLDCDRWFRGTECPCQRLDQPTCAEEELDDAMGVPRGTFAGERTNAEVGLRADVERHRDPAFVSEAEARERSR